MFAKNLNEFNIYLFEQTVYYSVSPSSNVPFDPLRSEEHPPPPSPTISCNALLSQHPCHFMIEPKKLKLDFNICTTQ